MNTNPAKSSEFRRKASSKDDGRLDDAKYDDIFMTTYVFIDFGQKISIQLKRNEKRRQ